MSVTFQVLGVVSDSAFSMNDRNTAEVLGLLGIPFASGEIKGYHLKARCAAAIAKLETIGDPEIPPIVVRSLGGESITCGGRVAGYLTMRIKQLLCLATYAKDTGVIQWKSKGLNVGQGI